MEELLVWKRKGRRLQGKERGTIPINRDPRERKFAPDFTPERIGDLYSLSSYPEGKDFEKWASGNSKGPRRKKKQVLRLGKKAELDMRNELKTNRKDRVLLFTNCGPEF